MFLHLRNPPGVSYICLFGESDHWLQKKAHTLHVKNGGVDPATIQGHDGVVEGALDDVCVWFPGRKSSQKDIDAAWAATDNDVEKVVCANIAKQ